MTEEDNSKGTCETYVPPAFAVLGGVSGAVEGFVLGGVVGAIPSAMFQTVGGYKIGEWVCDVLAGDQPEPPGPTPNPPPGTTLVAKG